VIFTSQVTICSHSSKLPAALKCRYGALANTKAEMTTAFASAGLNSATMEANTVAQIPGSYGPLSITGCKTMQIKHNAHKQDVF